MIPIKTTYQIILSCAVLTLSIACSKSPMAPNTPSGMCHDSTIVLGSMMDGTVRYLVLTDGNVYQDSASACKLVGKYFTPGFEKDNYTHVGAAVFIKTPDGPFPVRTEYMESFERYGVFKDLFLANIHDTDKYWNAMTLLSPLASTIPDYVALRNCILAGTCTFKDNRIDLVSEPINAINHILKFSAVAPASGMITSKSSIETTIAYFVSGDDLWYQARYFFTGAFPYSIVDFESQWFDLSPGPRIVFDNGALAIENKFGSKQKYRQPVPVPVPKNQWVTVKVHFNFNATSGTVDLWQDGNKILSVAGPNLPLSIAVQTNIEVGITSTDSACVLYLDDVKISKNSL